MANQTSREIRLKRRPREVPSADDFELAEVSRPEPSDGEFLVRNVWMSVDPYMRIRMRDQKSYAEPFQIGQPLQGHCVGRVVESNHPQFAVDDCVVSRYGWRDYWTSSGDGVQKVDPDRAPLQAYLGVLGMPGLTAYVGLLRIGELKQGETVLVSAAAGAVGSVVCQIAKIHNAKVIGTAGSPKKIEWLRNEAGVDEAINYKQTSDLHAAVASACGDGLDLYYDNVGGELLSIALDHMHDFGRIVCCGMISQYNKAKPDPGPHNLFQVIGKRLRMQGFLVFDHEDLRPQFYEDMSRWIQEGRLKWEETVVEGLEHAPEAFIDLFGGENLGKMVVRIG